MEIVIRTVNAAADILNGSSVWLVGSFLLAGLLHNIVSPEKFQKQLGNDRLSAILKGTISGMLLPICSCGVIPLGLSLYYSGAYLGPVLAFMVATPIINPAAVILSYGLLGPQIGTIYLLAGFLVPVIIGLLANRFCGAELQLPGAGEVSSLSRSSMSNQPTLVEKLRTGVIWGFSDMGMAVSKYVIPGMLLAGFIMIITPQRFIQNYLGNPGMISLLGIAVIGAVMYVCAVGHIPFIAAVLATGAAPGVAVTFLMAGAATNLPELISIYKLIGKRAAIIYSTTLIFFAFVTGYITNYFLMPGFEPVMLTDRISNTINFANLFIVEVPLVVSETCSLIILYLFIISMVPKVKGLYRTLIARCGYE